MILENNTDQIDSGNDSSWAARCARWTLTATYQHLLDQSPNDPEQTKGNKVIKSYVQNPELNQDAPPLNQVSSCEEQLTEIRKKYHKKYIHK